MESRKYLLVDAAVLPEVFLRVLRAKELLASGDAKNVSCATRLANVSRSAYYKYKDSVFLADSEKQIATIHTILKDETGALQTLLASVSSAGAGVVTLNQNAPENGAAQVSVTVRTEGMRYSLEELATQLKKQKTVVDIRLSQ